MQMRGANWEGGECCRWRGQRACQGANHGSALVALRPSLTSWPWPWPKCQRSPTRVSGDHCKTLAGDASPWQHSAHYRRRDGVVLYSVGWNHAHSNTHLRARKGTHTSAWASHLCIFSLGVKLPPNGFQQSCTQLGKIQRSLAPTLSKQTALPHPHELFFLLQRPYFIC